MELTLPPSFEYCNAVSNTFVQKTRPILKWAGGKTQLLPVLRRAMPKYFARYAEVFFGGGALFFDLALPNSIVCDSNYELIQFYRVVRDNPEGLLEAVGRLAISEQAYYETRSLDPDKLGELERAARFAYLNKTCYNGLHRVNKSGRFNTPFGGKTSVSILEYNSLHRASHILRDAELCCSTYKDALALLKPNDFVYLDPPYIPLGGHSDFRRYTTDRFGEPEHEQLATIFAELSRRGIYALLSNSDTEKVRSLYQQFWCVKVKANRQINCKSDKRGQITELLIANYPIEEDIVIS